MSSVGSRRTGVAPPTRVEAYLQEMYPLRIGNTSATKRKRSRVTRAANIRNTGTSYVGSTRTSPMSPYVNYIRHMFNSVSPRGSAAKKRKRSPKKKK
jgi:hypothetical protein